jgi:hypothetical protein
MTIMDLPVLALLSPSPEYDATRVTVPLFAPARTMVQLPLLRVQHEHLKVGSK